LTEGFQTNNLFVCVGWYKLLHSYSGSMTEDGHKAYRTFWENFSSYFPPPRLGWLVKGSRGIYSCPTLGYSFAPVHL